ncbi:ATP-dependent DNA helicase [Canariomyces notabilis]|uniref:DNA 3'-5' helicase n=1 Tax=Canariomyces notabilis TaxID=2074819 RepID=A0AAN6YT48_9PEZI|nr:ATP-dependent DNA helicase [Canariomyces arenarius]
MGFSDSSDYGDNIFEDLDEAEQAEQAELERPTKRQKSCHFDEVSASSASKQSYSDIANRILKEKFGYESFRHEQANAIQRILAGENALVIFPTGAGKSLCFQVNSGNRVSRVDAADGSRKPENAGVTLVVSPLIALMKDQTIYASLRRGQLRILYCAPERLNNEGFIESIKEVAGGIRLLAVDEAHCVSEWGHSFRPDYLKVARFAEEIKAERVICLTATATPKVAGDIRKAFKIQPQCVIRTSPYRPKYEEGSADALLFRLLGFRAKGESDVRFETLFRYLLANPGPTLVYVALQQQAETHADVLTKQGFNAAASHAGMKTEEKQSIQDGFMANRIDIICATIAFGMGIDKPDIRNVVHWDLSNSIEEYSQQIGRAGRDGKPSRCMFYLSPSAYYLGEVFARGDLPSGQSVRRLLVDIFTRAAAGLSVGEIFKVSHTEQTRDSDIRPTTLNVIYATLEKHFGLFRATTPEFTTHKFEAMSIYFPVLRNDKSAEAQAILSSAVKKFKYHDIGVNAAARASGGGITRVDIVRKLTELNDRGHIKLQASGLINRYIVQKRLPRTNPEIDTVLAKLYRDLESREEDAECFNRALTKHFGMGLPEGKAKCGHCTYCMTGKPVKPPSRPLSPTTPASIKDVLKATSIRDDPRFLAKIAFGIRSPRITELKLDRRPEFRSLAHHDFDALLREFTKACNTARR